MDNGQWVKRWDDHKINFHSNFIHPMLKKYAHLMVEGRPSLTILLPLCGKSWDIKWLADQGHTVIGVEIAQSAIEEFFEEQKLSFTSTPVPAVEGTLFQSDDKKVQIYRCDFFKISPIILGHVDAIWDSGAMVAVNLSDRARYATVVQSMMAPGCRYLLSAFQYDTTKFSGDPYYLDDEEIRGTFEGVNTVKAIGSMDVWDPWQKEAKGIDWMTEQIFLITPKAVNRTHRLASTLDD